ncbi:hypothetical protein CMO86_01185 [Candidatus Woesearchaeota archaeon]|jgi:hypothetical protein|nr:hypothetical protein [Candidatus Woesearchaeota archaeon]
MSRISDLAGFTTALSTTEDLSVGIITASTFSGDGSGLTGVASTDNIQTATSAKFLSNVNVSGITTLTTLQVTGLTTVGVVTGGTSISAGVYYGDGSALTGIDASTLKSGSDVKAQAVSTGVNITGNLVATGNVSLGGTLTYQDVTNMDVLGIGTFQQGIQVLANGANVTGIVTVGLSTIKSGEIEVVGVVTATTVKAGSAISITDGAVSATRFHGSGADLTGISATPVIGTDTSSPENTFVFLDLDNAQDHKLIASGITTISCTGGKEGDSHTVRITNSGITTIGFTTAFLFPSGASPSMPTASGALSLISFTINKAGTAGTELFTGASVNFS